MLSYQHAYHAGGPADVHKHVALSLLLAALVKKDKPFAVIDLYAGEGEYNLTHFAAQKTEEFKQGIGQVWEAKSPPPALQEYLGVLRHMNPDGELRRYPGSPALARAYLREQDRLILNELHSTAFPNLGRWARKDERIVVHKRDGLEALLGLTPPNPRRGLVLIDPSYEVKTEYAGVAEKTAAAVKKWREGVFVIWYPILKEARHSAMIEALKANVSEEMVIDELSLSTKRGDAVSGLLGTGLVVINPPWQFDVALRDAGLWLARTFERSKHSQTSLNRAAA